MQPENPDALHFLGVTHAMMGDLPGAEVLVRQAIQARPDYAEAHHTLGKMLQELGKPDEAIQSFMRVTRLESHRMEAYFMLGQLLEQRGRAAEALENYDRVIELDPRDARTHAYRGDVLTRLERLMDALRSYDRAIALEPGLGVAHGGRGDVLQKLDRLEEALASYDASIRLQPEMGQEHANRGSVLEKLGRFEEALVSFERAIELQPAVAEFRYHRGHALYELGRAEEALSEFSAVLKLDSGHAAAKGALFSHHLGELKDLALTERLCVEASELNVRSSLAQPLFAGTIFGYRVIHDLEQSAYLIARGHADDWLRRAHGRLQRIYEQHLAGKGDTAIFELIQLNAEEAADVNLFRKALLRYQLDAPIDYCLNPDNDWGAIEEQYFSSVPEIVCIDNLLAPRALQELRNFCLGSTLWKFDYENQYLGAFASTGFFSQLHFRIALELKERMPRIFGAHRLEQMWGFKYDPCVSKGINVHADAARVNLNFWITPDDANLDPESGGLIVYDVPSPASWSFRKYNLDEAAIYDFLQKNGSSSRNIPYRCNRAVLFNSTLFHETDKIHFKEGYENRRINITYLFGKGLRTM
jgi:tetratricopeptide (TPR) repeat protein